MVAARGPAARVIAVTSGKGGVGKTSLAVNLGVAAAALRKRVVLIDLDLGLANADVILGATPRATLAHVLAGTSDAADALVAAHGIHLLAGASGIERFANLDPAGRERLRECLERLHRRADLILIDTGAGISRNVIEFAAAADEAIVVTTPEPTALVDAYATIKMLGREAHAPRIRLVVNQALDREEAHRISTGVVEVARRFLKVGVERLGYVVKDDAVSRSVRVRGPVVVCEPRSSAAACIRNLSARLALGTAQVPADGFLDRVRRLFRRGA
jgi:flagellar biosynthesis protein FlhG